jgi:hypothetical protein
MDFFQSSEQFYTCAQALFGRMEAENPRAADSIQKARLIIRFLCQKPTVEVLINGRRKPVEIIYGPARIRPELDIGMPTDVLHRILLGELSLAQALATGSIKVRGPAWKTVALADLFLQTQSLYPQILHEQGLLG